MRQAIIDYRYEVDGQGLSAYPRGRSVDVAYDPADAQRAVLETGVG